MIEVHFGNKLPWLCLTPGFGSTSTPPAPVQESMPNAREGSFIKDKS
jgi:hypothetical protein